MTGHKKTVGLCAAIVGISALAWGSTSVLAQGPRFERRERHPEIREALRHLQMAKDALQRGAHDFGGHRQKALDLTNQAIDEAQQALRDDRR